MSNALGERLFCDSRKNDFLIKIKIKNILKREFFSRKNTSLLTVIITVVVVGSVRVSLFIGGCYVRECF